MSLRSRQQWFTFAAVWVAGAGCGCGQQAQLRTDTQPKPITAPDPAAAPAEIVPPEISGLAAQSQRDVDLILKSRAEANKKAQGENEPNPVSDDVGAAPSLRRVVVWNDHKQTDAVKKASTDVADDVDWSFLSAPSAKSAVDSAPPDPTSTKTLEPDRLKTLMVDLSRELYASGSYSSTPLRELLMIAAMSMVDPQRKLDPQAIPDLTEKERELLGKLQAFFGELGQSISGGGNDPEKAIVDAVAKLREGLVRAPTLRLATAALCTRVGGFGDYSAFNKNSFLAYSGTGSAQQKVIVYLEIEDFTSELNQKNEYVTQIAQQLTIYADRDGIPVWKEDWQMAVDVTKNKRQDFFTVQVVTLPKALTVGKYQLKVRARDEKSGAEAESAISFEMVADPRLAAAVTPGK